MGAATAHHRVIAFFQAADKAITAGGLCHRLHLGVAGAGPAHADIFPHRIIEQIVVLRDKGHLAVELGQRDFF